MGFYCDQPVSLVFQCFTFNFHFFFTTTVLYFNEIGVMRVLTVTWLNICLALSLLFLSTVIFYIYQLQAKITSTNEANIKLLDGMHEGVLIISKKTKEIIFFNKPAQKLLTSFVGVLQAEVNKSNENSDD